MKLSLRLLLGYFLIVAVAGYFVMNIFLQEVKPGVRRATEGMLVDTANLMAQIAALDLKDKNINHGRLVQAFANLNKRPIGANIDGIVKNRVEYRIYLTDAQGIVIFDSSGKALGMDYSRWNDVYLTLRGKYGVRSTREIPSDDDSTIMYVAAPVKIDGVLVGSLTVAKPSSTMVPVIRRSERRITMAGGMLLGIALLIGMGFVWWITRSIKKLMGYAENVSAGKPTELPKMDSPELSRLANALESMRLKLEGKAYVEQYVHTLTHELKSPLAAIRGAAEILQESPPPETAQRFLGNIQQQNQRMQMLIDRMLLLARVESRVGVEFSKIDFCQLVEKAVEGKVAQARILDITLVLSLAKPCSIWGDPLLLSQAVANLLDNALDFTPTSGEIAVIGEAKEGIYTLCVNDSGVGIPNYARDKIFDRFYSLPRPDKGKSSGLGLSFVKEVALLHQGEIQIDNRTEGGVVATLSLPIKAAS